MALTITVDKTDVFGNKRVTQGRIAFDSSYPTGGESLTARMIGMGVIENLFCEPAGGYLLEFFHSTEKVKVMTPVGALAAHSHGPGTLADAASGAGSAHTHSTSGTSAGGSSHTHSPTTKTLIHYEQGLNIQGSANTDSENVDVAAEQTNGAVVAAYATVAAGAWAHGALTNPLIGRNVCVTIKNDSGGPLNLYEGVMTFTITGTWRGAAQVETITFTSSAGNKAVVTAQWRYKYGVEPFDTVTDVTLDNVPDNGLKIGAGVGSKIGLLNDLLTPAEADILRWRKNGTITAVTGLVDVTNMTLNMGTLSDNDDFELWYKGVSFMSAIAAEATHTHGIGSIVAANESAHTHAVALDGGTSATDGAVTAAAGVEVANLTNLATLTDVRFFAIGT